MRDLYALASAGQSSLSACEVLDVALSLEKGVALDRVSLEGAVSIGAFTYANKNADIRHAVIGRYCSIAENVRISPGSHATDWLSTHPMLLLGSTNPYQAAPKTPTHIGNDVWIGAGATVMPSVRIGDGAVIAASAVVSRDVEPFAVMGGVPAKMIRHRFPEHVRQAILDARWWDYDFSTSTASLDFSDVTHVLRAIELARKEKTLRRLPARRRQLTITGRAVVSTHPPQVALR